MCSLVEECSKTFPSPGRYKRHPMSDDPVRSAEDSSLKPLQGFLEAIENASAGIAARGFVSH
jgi:hypothetical protein